MLTKRIEELVNKHGGLRPAARVLGVDASYLSKLRTGKKNNPSECLLRKLKLRKIVTVSFLDLK